MRFPFAPVEAHAPQYFGLHNRENEPEDGVQMAMGWGIKRTPRVGDDMMTLAERVGVSRRTLYRYQANGMSAKQADVVACALDTHPLLLWPELWMEHLREDS